MTRDAELNAMLREERGPEKAEQGDTGHSYGALFWIGTVIGWGVIAYGAKLLFDDPEADWFNTVRLAAIGVVAHDVVWLAVSVGGGWLLARLIGREIPYWIRWAGWTSAIVIAMWLPLGRGYGDRLNNDTILPRNYTTSIIILLAVIWVGGAAYGAIARARTSAPEGGSALAGIDDADVGPDAVEHAHGGE